jgi:hypothetical protein
VNDEDLVRSRVRVLPVGMAEASVEADHFFCAASASRKARLSGA